MFLVTCVYRQDMSSKYGGKPYDFVSEVSQIPGTLLTVQDRYGISLVKCLECKEVTEVAEYIKPVVDLAKVNEQIIKVHTLKQLQEAIREQMVKDIEAKAFASLAATNPIIAKQLEEYQALGGSYADLMPSINMLVVKDDSTSDL